MKLNTRHFGEIEVEETKIIDFEEGLPGFPDDKRFILLENEEPFCWLQSADDGGNAFILVDAFAVLPDYSPQVEREEFASLGEYRPDEYLIYNIVVLPEDINEMTVNLLAPILINSVTKKGRQVIAKNDDYGVRHFMLKRRGA